jgi:hypothetical protein
MLSSGQAGPQVLRDLEQPLPYRVGEGLLRVSGTLPEPGTLIRGVDTGPRDCQNGGMSQSPHPTYSEPQEWVEEYCDYCEREGHTFRACPARDDVDNTR